MDLRHDVIAIHEDGLAFGSTQRHVQDGPLLGDVDLLTPEHGVDVRPQAGLLCQLQQQPERLVGNAVFRIVEVNADSFNRQAFAARRIVREELAQMQLSEFRVMGDECLPGCERGEWRNIVATGMRGLGAEHFPRDRIPQLDNRHGRVVGVEGENAERRRAEGEMPCFGHRQSDPARGQHAADLAVSEECDISVQRAQAGDEAIGAVGNLRRHFTARTTIAIDIPVGPLLEDLQGTQSFVIAIVPFGEVGFCFRGSIQTGQLAGLPRALERTGEDMIKRDVPEALGKLTGLFLAICGQRYVRTTGVPA